MNVRIIGGGIGGLTAAIALGRAGHRVTLFERAPRFAPVGAGIVLGANATAILRSLGVDLSGGHPLSAMDVLGPDGRTLAALPVGSLGYEVLSFHRAELHAALEAALPPEVTLCMGEEAGVDDPDADVVIGADGLRSKAREAAGCAVSYRYSGETCWRAVIPDLELSRCTETWGSGARMGIVPLSGRRVYVFLTALSPERAPTPPWPELRARYAPLGGDCPAVLERLRPELLIHHDLVELAEPCWGTERVWLLGDAAHGMTPNQGQGAAMAIEDAAVLAATLEKGHAAYVAARHARVLKVQMDSRRFGQIASWTNPLARWARDLGMRMVPESAGLQHYRELVAPGLALVG